MDFQPYMTVQVVFIVLVVLFLIREIFVIRKESIEESNKLYCLLFVLLVGVLVRTLYLSYPYGLHRDEAIGGYDAWCLANYGVDSHLALFPVYLKSWGSGQSALYAYLAIPFIKIFGLSEPVFRLPMSIISSFCLLFLYYTLRKTQKNSLFIFCIIAFLAINPWHIIKSRYSLDCNIFPDLLIIGLCCIILGYYNRNNIKQNILIVLGFVVIAISAYGYGVSWFGLPLVVSLLLVYLYRTQKISLKMGIGILGGVILLVLPLILFGIGVISEKFEQYQIGVFTITKLSVGRHENTTFWGSENMLQSLWQYTKDAIRLIILGFDTSPSNSSFPYGIFYNLISVPFLIIGLKNIKEPSFRTINSFFCIILIASIPILLFVLPAIVHWNIIWFPLIYFTGYGLFLVLKNNVLLQRVFAYIYVIFFLTFLNGYARSEWLNKVDNTSLVKKEYLFAQDLKLEKLHTPPDMLYVPFLFYKPIDPKIFARTRVNVGDDMLTFVSSYDNVVIGYPDGIKPLPKTGYLIPTDYLSQMDLSEFKLHKGYSYSLIWND